MKKYLIFSLMTLFLLTGCGKTEQKETTANTTSNTEATSESTTAKPTEETTKTTDENKEEEKVDAKTVETMKATMTIKGMGDIEIELYPSKAPQSVSNFCELARDGFYEGVIFHRVIEGFMIQGGDPMGTGIGGPGYCIKGEFNSNGFKNDIKHDRGVLSMARKGFPLDSAGSQFFIMHQNSPHLDGEYAAFGKVTSGMEIVDKIATTKVDYNDRPLEDISIEKITIDGPILESPEKIKE